MSPQAIMGDIGKHDAAEFRAALKKAGISRIDTAALYSNGESEKKLGAAKMAEEFTIDTKVLYVPPGHNTLTPEAIDASLKNSLTALGVDQVNVLYCHGPDWETPLSVQAQAFDEQYRAGRFKYLGVSNFPPSMVEEWLAIAEKEDYVKPTYYEGQYNPICRAYETTLFPLLRKNTIHFAAYSPMAGGFLLGRDTRQKSPQNPYSAWYSKPGMHAAVAKFKELSETTGLGMDELALRWLTHHSILDDQDVIILGASKLEQIGNNTKQMGNGPLDEKVVQGINSMWKLCEEEAIDNLKMFERN